MTLQCGSGRDNTQYDILHFAAMWSVKRENTVYYESFDHGTELSLLKQSVSRPANRFPGL